MLMRNFIIVMFLMFSFAFSTYAKAVKSQYIKICKVEIIEIDDSCSMQLSDSSIIATSNSPPNGVVKECVAIELLCTRSHNLKGFKCSRSYLKKSGTEVYLFNDCNLILAPKFVNMVEVRIRGDDKMN